MARSAPPQIHGLCLIKNEADVIEESLREAARWCDHVYILDNGSTDSTWEIVEALSRELPCLVPWKRDPVPFVDGLRSTIFDRFRDRAQPDDWWCLLDADEFYLDDPRVFLQKVPARYEVVWTATFSYYFTDRDAEVYRLAPERYGEHVPVREKIRYYVNHWSEPRFFRAREEITWSIDQGEPSFLTRSAAYPVRIWLQHFAYRSPQQIERRLADRQDAISRGVFSHEAIADWGQAVAAVSSTRDLLNRTGRQFATSSWEERIVPATSLEFDEHNRRLVVNERLMPKLPTRSTAAVELAMRLPRVPRRLANAVLRRVKLARAPAPSQLPSGHT